MQCPACNHIPLAGNQPDPNACPKCLAPYSESIRSRIDSVQRAKDQASAQRQAANAVAPHVKRVMADYRGAQPVVVLDVNMSFMSMVWFMIKWALAAIPALVILSIIVVVLFSVFGGLMAGVMSLNRP